MINQGNWKKLVSLYLPIGFLVSLMSLPALVLAAATISVSPSTNLTNGQVVTVSGSGLAASSIGSILECNSDPNQPTVTVAGNAVPVSCSNPLSTLISTDKNGNLPSTPFTVKTGTVGPPGSGTDSSGNSSASDAAKYPCPPTAAQIAAGDSCNITYGDQGGDDAIQNITFVGQTTTTTPPATTTSPNTTTTTTTPTTATPTTSSISSKPSTLTNTGPGNTIGIFIGVAVLGALAHFIYSYRKNAKNSVA